MTTQRTLEEWLSLAYETSDDCPPPELFLEAEWSSLGEVDRRAVEAHVKSCPACSAERELARAFDEPASNTAEADAGVESVLETIDSNGDRRYEVHHQMRSGRLVRFPAMARALSRPAIGLAAAAVAVVAVGIILQMRTAGPPALPAGPSAEIVRGSGIEVIAPVGSITEIPKSLGWDPVDGAVHYEVTMTAVDETVLWRDESRTESIALPEEIRKLLRPAVLYYWRVEAFDESGSRIAWSPAVEFRADPGAVSEETR